MRVANIHGESKSSHCTLGRNFAKR